MNEGEGRGWGAIGGFLLLCVLGLVGLIGVAALSAVGRPGAPPVQDASGNTTVVEAGRQHSGDVEVANGDVRVETGAQVDGSVTAANGNILISPAARVNGDVTAQNGRIQIAGRVAGNVSSLRGPIVLERQAVIDGTVLASAGDIYESPGATVNGAVTTLNGRVIRDGSSPLSDSPAPVEGGFWLRVLGALMLGVAGLAGGLGLLRLVPRRLARVEATLEHALRPSATVGALTAVLVPPVWLLLSVILSLTVIGPFLLTLALLVGLFSGLVAVGLWLGERLAAQGRLPRRLQTPQGHSLLGLALVLGGPLFLGTLVPWLGSLLLYLLSSLGVGALILSRMGTLAPVGSATVLPFSLPAQDPQRKAS